MKKLLLISLLSCLIGCQNTEDFEKGKRQLEAQGYTEITTTGYDAWCCGEDDDYSTGFTARDPKGNFTTGCICSGMLGKGVTIRYK